MKARRNSLTGKSTSITRKDRRVTRAVHACIESMEQRWMLSSSAPATGILTPHPHPGVVVPAAPGTLAGTIVSFTPTENTAYTGPVATFSDTDPTDTAAGFTATISWGDGSSTVGTVTGGSGSFSVAGTHTYAEDGSESVSVVLNGQDNNIQVNDATTSATLGYVSNTFNSFDIYTITNTPANYLDVTLEGGSPFGISEVNNPASSSHTSVGGVVGSSSGGDDLAAGSSNYVYLNGTDSTAANAPPAPGGSTEGDALVARDIESNIWSTSGTALSPQWVNSDSSTPTTIPIYDSSEDGLYLIGDPTAFAAAFPETFETVAFALVPAQTATASGTIQVAEGDLSVPANHTLSFVELPPQFVNGVSIQGVTFSDTTGAVYDTSDGGQETFVQDPALVGSTLGESLQMDFATPTPVLNFGVALSTFGPVTDAATVQLFDKNLNPIPGSFTVDTNSIVFFSEGQFSYSGTPVGRAIVTFNSSEALSFAVDNLSFSAPLTGNANTVLSNLQVATFIDPSEFETAGSYTAAIDWGDGSAPTPGTITYENSVGTVTGTHNYIHQGTYTISTTVTETGIINGTASGTATAIIAPGPDLPIFATPNTLVGVEGIPSTGSAQTLTENKATGGTFTLQFSGATTAPLPYNATAAQVQTALNGLSTVIAKGGVTVSENAVGTSTVYEVLFSGQPDGTPEPQIIPITTALTGTGHSIQDATYFGVIASFTDADPAGMVGDYIANINWGDGSSGTVGVIVANSTGGFDVLAKHSFGEEGSYQTVVSIQDAGSGTSATSTIDVADPAVVAAAATPSAFSSVEGASTGSLVLATFTDPGGAEPNKYDPDPNLYDHYTATINWGDGSTPDLIDGTDPNGTITFNAATKTFTVHGTHSYLEESAAEHPGSTPYIVSVVIHHEEAPDSNLVTDTVTVSDPAVIGNAGTTFTGVEGQSTGPIKVAVFSDPGIPVGGTPEPVGDYSATVNWGDGSAPDNNATISYLSGNFFSVTDSHTWAEESPAGKPLFVKVTVHHEAAPDAVVTTDLATVTDPSVVAVAVPQINGTEGAPTGVIALATFSDPGTPAGEPLADYSATINWGDGTAPSVGSISVAGGNFTVSGSHTYKEESGPDEPNSQPYQVTVTINHDTAAPTVVSDTAVMADPAVVAVGVPAISAKPGVSTGTIALATFSDPGGNEPSDDYSATINWGDGSSQVAGTVTLSNGVLTVTGSHVFDVPGTFHPTIVVHHESAPDSNVVTDTVNVVASKPTLTASATSNNGQEGRSSTITVANFVSTISNAATSNFTASIAWGDGATTTGVIVKDSTGHFHVTGSHAYAEEQSAAFTVKVTIKDNAGNTAVANSSYKIVDSPLDSGAGVSISEKHGVAFSKVTLGTFRDQDALNTNAGDYKGTINWGDGTSTSAASFVFTSATSNVGSYWKVLGGHTYSTSGKTYTVKITIQDTGGSSPITITSTIKTT